MFFATAVLVSLAAVATAQVTVTTTELAQCSSSVISYTGSTGPYYVAIIPADNACQNDALYEWNNVEGTSVDYPVNIAEGTQVVIYVEDANQVESWSGTITVGGGDASCLPGNEVTEPEVEAPAVTPSSSAPAAAYTPPAPSSSRAAVVVPENNAPSPDTPVLETETDETETTDTNGAQNVSTEGDISGAAGLSANVATLFGFVALAVSML